MFEHLRSTDLFYELDDWHKVLDTHTIELGEYVKNQKKLSKNDSGEAGMIIQGE